jgi:hypothetical protein
MLRPRLLDLAPLAIAAGISLAPPAVAADLGAVCAPEIERHCSAVQEGRGRVTACLAIRTSDLSAPCRDAVRGLVQNPLTPGWVRSALTRGGNVPLPRECAAPAARYCPGLSAGSAIFACLYAYSERIPRSCPEAAEATLKSRQ